MIKFTTLAEMIAIHARATPAAVAISAPDAVPLNYAGVHDLVGYTVKALNSLGVRRGDRVAIVLPNCPEMAAGFVAVASACTAAPLNIAYRADEFEFYLTDLKAKALIVAEGAVTPARDVALRLNIPVFELIPTPTKGAGTFLITGPGLDNVSDRPDGLAESADIALILHTSGTTSRPKIVPLSHTNVCASARNISRALALTPKDRELHVMPLFHIHGLIAGVLAPMAVGSEIFVTPGFNALKFFSWMKEFHPTWYTAVPTMHQAILSRAAVNAEVIAANPLRFLRSSSSSMPTQVIAELERWNGDTLALSAPTAGQFVVSEAALAALDVNSLRADGVQTAALLVPSGAGSVVSTSIVPVTAAPAVVKLAPVQMAQVTAPRAMNVAIQAASKTALKPVVIRASVSTPRSAEAALVRAAKTDRLAAVAKVRPQAVAMLDRKLLSDTTLGDIMSGARSESRKRR